MFDIAEASVVKVGVYVELCSRSGEVNADQKRRSMELLRRIALTVRGRT